MSERDDKKPSDDDLEALITPEERRAAERLRDALDGRQPSEDAALATALRSAWSPAALDERAHAELLDELPRSGEETAMAEELRDALARGAPPEVVTALRAAWSPHALDERDHHALVEAAVGGERANVLPFRRPQRGVAFVGGALALAAAIAFWIGAPSNDAAPLARTRSTTPLFNEPFRDGEGSARIDRIAIARAADYRDNRFSSWGVR